MTVAERFEEDKKWFWEEQIKIQERSRKEQKQDIPEIKIVEKQEISKTKIVKK